MSPKFIFVTFLILILSLKNYSVAAELDTPPYIEIYDERALNVLDPEAVFNILGEGYSWSEGPLWIAEQNMLLFSDVPQNVIYQYKESEGVSVYLKPSGATGIHIDDSQQGANGLVLDPEGKLLIMQHGDRRVSVMDAPLDAPMPIYISLVSHYEDKRLNSPNDGVFHSNGDLYFTDPPYGLSGGRNSPHKQLSFDGIYRLSKAGKLTLEDDSVLYPNGIILSNDESKAFVASSNRADAKWYQYDIAGDGSLVNKKVFYDVSDLVGQTAEKGLPDGFAMHAKGYLFATGPGGVFLFTESGELLAKIRTGKSTANCALSADQKTLFMTAHDTLMSIRLK